MCEQWEKSVIEDWCPEVVEEFADQDSDRPTIVFITYHPQIQVFSRDNFAVGVAKKLTSSKFEVKHWCAAEELSLQGVRHFHMVVKFVRKVTFSAVNKCLSEIKCHAIARTDTYKSYIHYLFVPSVSKPLSTLDPKLRYSKKHPKVIDADMEKKRAAGKKVDFVAFMHLVSRNKLKSEDDLLKFNTELMQKKEYGLSKYIGSHRDIEGELRYAWKCINGEPATEDPRHRLDFLVAAASLPCVCNDKMVASLIASLSRNSISEFRFCYAILFALYRGAKKTRNIFIIGPSNSGKSEMIGCLEEIYSDFCFLAPVPHVSYPLVELLNKKVAVFQDFRWPCHPLTWSVLLNLFEGNKLVIGLPRTNGVQNILYKSKVPFFITAKEFIQYRVGKDFVDPEETDMMKSRFTVFKMPNVIPPSERIEEFIRCKSCYARWILRVAGESVNKVIAKEGHTPTIKLDGLNLGTSLVASVADNEQDLEHDADSEEDPIFALSQSQDPVQDTLNDPNTIEPELQPNEAIETEPRASDSVEHSAVQEAVSPPDASHSNAEPSADNLGDGITKGKRRKEYKKLKRAKRLKTQRSRASSGTPNS